MNIGFYDVDDYMRLAKTFHGNVAPGLLVGGFMVDLGMKNMMRSGNYNAVSETYPCIPDAIQILTPCTVGNGRLRIMDYGRYALSFYGNNDGQGVRVSVDPSRLDEWPEIKTWFLRLKPKTGQNLRSLTEQIIEANTEILSIKEIEVKSGFYALKNLKTGVFICPGCGEAFTGAAVEICENCADNASYYVSAVNGTDHSKQFLKVISKE